MARKGSGVADRAADRHAPKPASSGNQSGEPLSRQARVDMWSPGFRTSVDEGSGGRGSGRGVSTESPDGAPGDDKWPRHVGNRTLALAFRAWPISGFGGGPGVWPTTSSGRIRRPSRFGLSNPPSHVDRAAARCTSGASCRCYGVFVPATARFNPTSKAGTALPRGRAANARQLRRADRAAGRRAAVRGAG